MPDVFLPEKRSAVMALIRSKGNRSTELRFAKLMRDQGVKGWRRSFPLEGKPDFVFPKARLAIFIEGCFWHGCATHGRRSNAQQPYWIDKIARNQRRDRAVSRQLREKHWRVLRIWEHALQVRHQSRTLNRLKRALNCVNSVVRA